MSFKDWLSFGIFFFSVVYMVDLQVIKQSLDQEGIKNGYVEGNLSVRELTRNIANVFENQTGGRDGSIDVSLSSELVLNWILNVYDPWVQIEILLHDDPFNKEIKNASECIVELYIKHAGTFKNTREVHR